MGLIKKITKWLLLSCLVAIPLLILLGQDRRPDSGELLKALPLESAITDCNKYIESLDVRRGIVQEWTPRTGIATVERIERETLGPTPGEFKKVDVVDFDKWRPTGSEQDSFTGALIFFRDRYFRDSEIIWLIFYKGRLVRKEWGTLPG